MPSQPPGLISRSEGGALIRNPAFKYQRVERHDASSCLCVRNLDSE